jgi:DNA-binding CsgD family transcriptional regulator
MSGLSVAEIADKRGASVLTVRTQLRSILEKTQSSRQADLFKLTGLLNGPSSNAIPVKG